MKKYWYIGVSLLVIIFVILLFLTPLGIIWALNTLFPVLAIPYTFWTWLAVIVLNLTWMGRSVVTK